MLGTFEPEDPNEPAVYGLVKPVQSYNPFYLQMHHWMAMIENMCSTQGWKNKLMIPFKGPGWAPGKPRLGYLDDIPHIEQPVTYWNPKIHILQKIYTVWHFAVILIFYHELTQRYHELTQITVMFCIIALLVSITSVGFLLENKPFALQFEILRCLLFFGVERSIAPSIIGHNMVSYDIHLKKYLTSLCLLLSFLLTKVECHIGQPCNVLGMCLPISSHIYCDKDNICRCRKE
ncbi:unnamed protein product, partial [Oppiella nova]